MINLIIAIQNFLIQFWESAQSVVVALVKVFKAFLLSPVPLVLILGTILFITVSIINHRRVK